MDREAGAQSSGTCFLLKFLSDSDGQPLGIPILFVPLAPEGVWVLWPETQPSWSWARREGYQENVESACLAHQVRDPGAFLPSSLMISLWSRRLLSPSHRQGNKTWRRKNLPNSVWLMSSRTGPAATADGSGWSVWARPSSGSSKSPQAWASPLPGPPPFPLAASPTLYSIYCLLKQITLKFHHQENPE